MRSTLSLAALAAALCFAAPATAQTSQAYIPVGVDSIHTVPDSAATPVSVNATTANIAAPASAGSLTGLRAAVHKSESRRPSAPTMMATRGNLGQARALMVVGAAAFIAGAIVEGDAGRIFMVGGAIIGLYGLYEYLQ